MATDAVSRTVRVRAFAKINLTLRILGVRRDGYHELSTTLQTLALHDTLTFTTRRGPFEIWTTDPTCPVDATNLVWRAAAEVWRAARRQDAPTGVSVRVKKRIPLQSGLGGGSSDAAAALGALARLWRVRLSRRRLTRLAGRLGADVPFFLEGGTAVATGRGDRLHPLDDWPASWIVLGLPDFGVSTTEAYGWWDAEASGTLVGRERRNDLEPCVTARHPEIGRIVIALKQAGASIAALSGSGSAAFGLFAKRSRAERAARALTARSWRALVTRTLGRQRFETLARPW